MYWHILILSQKGIIPHDLTHFSAFTIWLAIWFVIDDK